jgi:zinc finger HIT domain-containing protein 1
MAEGPLRFRTPHIEELPVTNSRHQPGFAWVAVKKDAADPSMKAALDVAGKKRARTTGLGGQTEAQREATTARQQREIERRIRDLNSDNTRDVNIAIPKREHQGGGGATKAGKTSNTKKILSSGKEFKHYLDDEEAELARTGKIDGLERDPDAVVVQQPVQRASKTPLARRIQREQSSASGSPAPAGEAKPQGLILPFAAGAGAGAGEDDDEFDGVPSLPTREEGRLR